METFQNIVTIARPVEEVYAFLADFQNVPRWNYAIEQTRKTSPGPAGVGATYRQTRTIPRRSHEVFQVTLFAPPSRLAAQGQIGPFHAKTSYRLESAAGGTRLTNNVELEPSSALLRLIGPLACPPGQGDGGAQPRHAEAGPGKHQPRSRRSLVMFVIVLPSKHAAGFGALR